MFQPIIGPWPGKTNTVLHFVLVSHGDGPIMGWQKQRLLESNIILLTIRHAFKAMCSIFYLQWLRKQFSWVRSWASYNFLGWRCCLKSRIRSVLGVNAGTSGRILPLSAPKLSSWDSLVESKPRYVRVSPVIPANTTKQLTFRGKCSNFARHIRKYGFMRQ